MMRSDLAEGLILGAVIGLVVLAIHELTSGAPSELQLLALFLAGLLLCGVQLLLSLRRSRHKDNPPGSHPEPSQPILGRRARRQTLFIQELTRNWTGLNDRLPVEDEAPPPDREVNIDEPVEKHPQE